MYLSSIHLRQFRIFSEQKILLQPGINVLHGNNACGKTSILEAIWCTVNATSFRKGKKSHWIQYGQEEASVYLEFAQPTYSAGQHIRSESQQFSWNKTTVPSSRTIAEHVRLLFLGPDSTRLLTDAPQLRRQFIDRALFLINPSYLDAWRNYHRTLSQRNHCLRAGKHPELDTWDNILVNYEESITSSRQKWIKQLEPILQETLDALIPKSKSSLIYQVGYNKNTDFHQILAQQRELDIRQQFTFSGPQRGDIQWLINNDPVNLSLSRGQLKIVTTALHLAQLQVMAKQHKEAILLLDDFSSELDEHHRTLTLKILQALPYQTVITTVDPSLVPSSTVHLIPIRKDISPPL